jgi:hypothetical protein
MTGRTDDMCLSLDRTCTMSQYGLLATAVKKLTLDHKDRSCGQQGLGSGMIDAIEETSYCFQGY